MIDQSVSFKVSSIANWMSAVDYAFSSVHIEAAIARGEVHIDTYSASEFKVYTYLDGVRDGLRRTIPAEADCQSCLDYLDRVIRAKIALALELYDAKETMVEKNNEA